MEDYEKEMIFEEEMEKLDRTALKWSILVGVVAIICLVIVHYSTK